LSKIIHGVFFRGKKWQNIFGSFCNFQKTAQRKQSPNLVTLPLPHLPSDLTLKHCLVLLAMKEATAREMDSERFSRCKQKLGKCKHPENHFWL
jgi:hypothetical protein